MDCIWPFQVIWRNKKSLLIFFLIDVFIFFSFHFCFFVSFFALSFSFIFFLWFIVPFSFSCSFSFHFVFFSFLFPFFSRLHSNFSYFHFFHFHFRYFLIFIFFFYFLFFSFSFYFHFNCYYTVCFKFYFSVYIVTPLSRHSVVVTTNFSIMLCFNKPSYSIQKIQSVSVLDEFHASKTSSKSSTYILQFSLRAAKRLKTQGLKKSRNSIKIIKLDGNMTQYPVPCVKMNFGLQWSKIMRRQI